ncbi:MAG: GTP cyclohydrolase I FolE [Lutisporaceae bacterium]
MIDKDRIKKAIKEILYAIGEDPDREGLVETPDRVANMYEEIFAGLHRNPMDDIKLFNEDQKGEMIVVKDIPFYSMCEHHLVPFYGVAHVVYIPEKGEVLGLSKIVRIVDIISKKPQLQERLCSEIADVLVQATAPAGVAVLIEAEHMCMTMRGVSKPGAKTVTSVLRGILKTDAGMRTEALSLINGR